MFDGSSRRGIALAAFMLVLAVARGVGQQQPPRPNTQTPTGLPPGTPTQQSPSEIGRAHV